MMFFKKNKGKKTLSAVIDGNLIPLEDVNDDVFSQKILGNGAAIVPTGNIVAAPCDGTVTMIAKTLHAYGFKTDDGVEILVHIGLDTVKLNGEGFKKIVEVGTHVKNGQPIIEFDKEFMNKKGLDMTTMIIIMDQDDVKITIPSNQEVQKGRDTVISYSKG